MRILITGGAGFIGSHVCDALLRTGHEVAIIDNMNDFYDPAVKRKHLADLATKGKVAFYELDIRNRSLVNTAFEREKPEIVVHLAARAGIRPSIADPEPYVTTNVEGTVNILEAIRMQSVRKLIFASSSSVYGERSTVPFRESDEVTRPISPYAATKLAGEQLVYTYCHLYGLQALCLRFFTVYGPRQRPDLAIRVFYERLRMGLPVTVFGDGSSGRDYTFISDIVKGILAAIECDIAYEVVNLGSGRPVLLREMIAELGGVLAVRPQIRFVDSQPGDVEMTYASTAKAEHLLGYCPKVTFAEGIRRFHLWYSEQECAKSYRLRSACAAESSRNVSLAVTTAANLPGID